MEIVASAGTGIESELKELYEKADSWFEDNSQEFKATDQDAYDKLLDLRKETGRFLDKITDSQESVDNNTIDHYYLALKKAYKKAYAVLEKPMTVTGETFSYELYDKHKDGWDGGAAILVYEVSGTSETQVESITLSEGGSLSGSLTLNPTKDYVFRWHKGDSDIEISFTIKDSAGEVVCQRNDLDYTKDGAELLRVAASVTDISTAAVNLAADNSVSSTTIGDDTINALESDFDITYGKTAETATTAFPTEAGKYYAFVTAKENSTSYTGTAKSAQFVVNGTLADGQLKQTAQLGDIYYTRFVFVVPKSEFAGKSKAKFTANYNGKAYPFETNYYYIGVISNGIIYTSASEDSAVLL